jgi:uncharacterized protein
MELTQRVAEDLKQAMKDRDKLRLNVLRMVKTAVKYQEIDRGAALSDEDVLSVFQKELKQRKDSLASFEQAGRTDLVDEVKAEIAVLMSYLPQPLTEAELTELAAASIAATGATGKADMGKVMSDLMPKIRGRADGKATQQVVTQLLSNL